MADIGTVDSLDNLNQANAILGSRRGKDPCPECGSPQVTWYAASGHDPDDVDPRACCTNPQCHWGY